MLTKVHFRLILTFPIVVADSFINPSSESKTWACRGLATACPRCCALGRDNPRITLDLGDRRAQTRAVDFAVRATDVIG